MSDQEKNPRAIREEEILELWKENKIFEKTLEKESPEGEFVFFEGPPTANGRPGIHHIEARSFKDIIPRYKTMKGYHVRRKGGWDTHGLPVEIEAEKQLGLKSKKEIEEYGIAEFNKKCKESVWTYVDEWTDFTNRIAYWVDLENPYITYQNNYIESVWSVFKKVDDQNLLYKDYKVVPWCPRCGTGLSSHELAQGYKDVKDLSVTAKFKVIDEEDTYILAWTTTPWTLPGNVALAVGEDIDYVKIKKDDEFLILAKELLEKVLKDEFEIVEDLKGKDLIGKSYEPLYPYLKEKLEDKKVEGLDKAFQIYAADFVTTTDGTGVVHTAVMYGQDDFELGNKLGLPKYHLVTQTGMFIDGTDFLEGRFVKDEDVAIDIIKNLAHRGLLFSKEKYEHSYPHCWRCKTPLIYYARDSWYIRMSDLREKLLKGNEKINWEPSHIKDGRFGEWLKDVKDWAISRERYWGTPLPVWEKQDGEKIVIGSIEDIKKYTKKSGNKYNFIRHGESHNNVAEISNSTPENDKGLTEKGEEQAREASNELVGKGITKIFSSPMPRSQETARIIAEKLGIEESEIVTEEKLIEIKFGKFEDGHIGDFIEHRQTYAKFGQAMPGGESHRDVTVRVGEFLEELEEKYSDTNILMVGHGAIGEALIALENYSSDDEAWDLIGKNHIHRAKPMEFDFTLMPHDEKFILDLHKPYIDEIDLFDGEEKLTRTKEVMDVWFDSGAMPFAQDHYPFENEEWVDGPGVPADFISEAIDQTRGWFYTLHAVANLMGRDFVYKNCICLGHILDAEGKKMSKSVGNVVNPWEMIDKHGADALRMWMYTVNAPGDSKNFDEKTVVDLSRKVFTLSENILSFYKLYSEGNNYDKSPYKSPNVLDQWILSLKDKLVSTVVNGLDTYNVITPAREIREFIGELSQWYIRRSRDRFKGSDAEDKYFSLATTQLVLNDLAKIMAPFTPFFAEYLYQQTSGDKMLDSVHLENFPAERDFDEGILEKMTQTRSVISLGLEARQKAGQKVRQPLQSLTVIEEIEGEYKELIKDEVNIKEVLVGKEISLDTEITPELQEEGNYRDFVRAIQAMRKNMGLEPQQYVQMKIETGDKGKALIEKFLEEFKETTQVKDLDFENTDGEEISIDGMEFKVKII